MHKVRSFSQYKERYTQLVFMDKKYHLSCEGGIFLLYDTNGLLVARTFKNPFKGRRQKTLNMEAIREEDKFALVTITDDIIGLRESLTGIVHDFLIWEDTDADNFNYALYLYVSKVLMEEGYDKQGKVGYSAVYNIANRQIIIGGKVTVSIKNLAVIYDWSGLKNVVEHLTNIFSDLNIIQFCELKI